MLTRSIAFCLSALCFAATPLFAQSNLTKIDASALLSGVSSSPLGSANPDYDQTHVRRFTEAGGKLFFTAQTKPFGRELYALDPKAGKAELLADIVYGLADTKITEIVAFQNWVYFVVAKTPGVSKLWVSDGTPLGTFQFLDLNPGVKTDAPRNLTSAGNLMFFTAIQFGLGEELFVTDGTLAGTGLVKELISGPLNANPHSLIANPNGSGVLFSGNDVFHGQELWRSDGTAAGTQLVTELAPGTKGGGFERPVALGNRVIFLGKTGALGEELYVTDGTAAGTMLLADIEPGSKSSKIKLHEAGLDGTKLYFTATTAALGTELYVTDGTPAGTQLALDGVVGPGSSNPELLGAVAGELYMSLRVDPAVGRELYAFGAAGLRLVHDLAAGPGASSNPREGLVAGGRVYFDAEGASGETGLWVTDGTSAGTSALFESETHEPRFLTAYGPSELYFSGWSASVGEELFTTDGTPAGSRVYQNLHAEIDGLSSLPRKLAVVDGSELYFTADAAQKPDSLMRWRAFDGLTDMTGDWSWPKDEALQTPVRGVDAAWLGDHEDRFFTALSPQNKRLLMHTDGTAAGTVEVTDFGGSMVWLDMLGTASGWQLFRADDGVHGRELWRTDGTAAGTSLVVDLNPGAASSGIGAALAMGGKLYFRANDGISGSELWTTDGTLAGTVQVADINAAGNAGINHLTAFGELLLLTATDGVHGAEPWVTDGTLAGTKLLADVRPGGESSKSVAFVVADALCYFFADDDAVIGRELWRTDGTPVGTSKAATVDVPGYGDVDAAWAGGKLFFAASDPAAGNEPWVFDGQTASGAADLVPGVGSSVPSGFTACGERVYFRAETPATGFELFVSDGTPLGTQLALDIQPGPGSSSPSDFTLVGGDLLFVAAGQDLEVELYRYTLPGAHVLELGFGGNGPRLTATTPALGSNMQATVTGAPLGAINLLLLSNPVGPNAAFVSAASASWIDLFSVQLMSASSQATWTTTVQVPATPSLIGAQVNLQMWSLPPGLLPADTSNGLRLVLGS